MASDRFKTTCLTQFDITKCTQKCLCPKKLLETFQRLFDTSISNTSLLSEMSAKKSTEPLQVIIWKRSRNWRIMVISIQMDK